MKYFDQVLQFCRDFYFPIVIVVNQSIGRSVSCKFMFNIYIFEAVIFSPVFKVPTMNVLQKSDTQLLVESGI